ncbi:hypothetical protein [Escherichia coli]|uniref:hypothetical protein n=1 Tax=Escherichia coli TaxID=562 RepID=UPI0007D6DE8A|nr:hypothetical protein [Escherichia coli]RRE38902.1 hypothetical protein EAO16_07630 [Klebsiella pneumoniae]HBK2596528.1 hypothetical protein [Escherichia coli]HBY6190089.1 hypothetical protein [Klebsiella pneumoniae]HBY6261272.1 hypothetical protein [Klebsiella pneumoniae]
MFLIGELMDNSFITKELGERNPYPKELYEISMKFTMAFYYCEDHFFSRRCSIRESDTYSNRILSIVEDECSPVITETFKFFQGRYMEGEMARHRLYALTMQEEGGDLTGLAEAIYRNLENSDGDIHAMLSVCLKVIIRLRHNLLHANKYEAMIGEPEEQKILINRGYMLLSSLLFARNTKLAV